MLSVPGGEDVGPLSQYDVSPRYTDPQGLDKGQAELEGSGASGKPLLEFGHPEVFPNTGAGLQAGTYCPVGGEGVTAAVEAEMSEEAE